MENTIIFQKLKNFSEKNYIKEPLIVGGNVRDYVMGINSGALDVDLTTNDSDVTRCAIGFAAENNLYYKVFKDLHVTVYIDGQKDLDFSSNFISKLSIDFFKNSKFSENKYHEVISRDFTINTLHKNMFSEDIIDMLSVGLKDIDNRTVKCVSSPKICFLDDPRRIYRAVSLSARLNFTIDNSIFDFSRNNYKLFSVSPGVISDGYITSSIDRSIGINDDLLINNLFEMKIIQNVPLVGKFKDLLIKKNKINEYLDSKKYLY